MFRHNGVYVDTKGWMEEVLMDKILGAFLGQVLHAKAFRPQGRNGLLTPVAWPGFSTSENASEYLGEHRNNPERPFFMFYAPHLMHA